MMRPQWIAWLAIGIVTLYVILTVMGRMSEGRCEPFSRGLDCTNRKPIRINPPGVGETIAMHRVDDSADPQQAPSA